MVENTSEHLSYLTLVRLTSSVIDEVKRVIDIMLQRCNSFSVKTSSIIPHEQLKSLIE